MSAESILARWNKGKRNVVEAQNTLDATMRWLEKIALEARASIKSGAIDPSDICKFGLPGLSLLRASIWRDLSITEIRHRWNTLKKRTEKK